MIWIISNEQWPRALLRAELIERGYDAIGFPRLEDALLRIYSRAADKPHAAILDLNEAEITRALLSALATLNIPTIILGGAVELNDPMLVEFQWTAVFRRPFAMGDVAAAIAKLVPVPS